MCVYAVIYQVKQNRYVPRKIRSFQIITRSLSEGKAIKLVGWEVGIYIYICMHIPCPTDELLQVRGAT